MSSDLNLIIIMAFIKKYHQILFRWMTSRTTFTKVSHVCKIIMCCNTLLEKSNFCPKIQFWQNPNIFTSFSPKFFLAIFLVNSKLSTAKNSKTTTFSRGFHPKKSPIFSGNQSWIFGQKMKISNSVRYFFSKHLFWMFDD